MHFPDHSLRLDHIGTDLPHQPEWDVTEGGI
ncbi:hypothetical protein ABIC83_006086 [Roseateles asaccharophilus]|uniref:Uncharacterized protein n=1 Tax=Roseateles asaccharophilus TaxID=582607 RepID=A0ABU2AG42_9BURK|nr:hypothetical protein [Roseateles asaccharophilus]